MDHRHRIFIAAGLLIFALVFAMTTAVVATQGIRWGLPAAGLLAAGAVIGIDVTLSRLARRRDGGPRAVARIASSTLHREACDPIGLFVAALSRHRGRARDRGIDLQFEPRATIPFHADKAEIGRVLDDLVGLAIDVAPPRSELVASVAPVPRGIRFEVATPVGDTTRGSSELERWHSIVDAHGGLLVGETVGQTRRLSLTLPTEPGVLR